MLPAPRLGCRPPSRISPARIACDARYVPLDAPHGHIHRVVSHREVRGHRKSRWGPHLTEEVPVGPRGRVRAVLHGLCGIERRGPDLLGDLAGIGDAQGLHGQHVRGQDHLVDEHVGAVALVDRVVLGLGVAGVDHGQAVPLQLVADGALAGVDHREVGDLHAGGGVVVGEVVSLALPPLGPVQLDGDEGVAVGGWIVRDGPAVVGIAPAFPCGGVVAGVAGGLEGEALGRPAEGIPDAPTEGPRTIVVLARRGVAPRRARDAR